MTTVELDEVQMGLLWSILGESINESYYDGQVKRAEVIIDLLAKLRASYLEQRQEVVR